MKRPVTFVAMFTLLTASASSRGQNAADLVNTGMQKAQQNDVEGAIADFTKAIELQPENLDAYRERALAKVQKRDLDGALADLNHCLSLKADDARAIYERGRVRRVRGDADGAISDFNAVIELKGDNALFYNNRGLAKLDKSDADGAIADYTKALELKPAADLALLITVNRGRAELFKEDATAALADATRAVQMNPGSPDALILSALARQAKGDVTAALADLARVTTLDPRNPRVYLIRANMEVELGNVRQAAESYDKAVELAPNEPELRASRGYYRYEQHAWADARADFKFALDNSPPPPDDYVRFRICLIDMYTGDKAAAAKAMHDYMAARKSPTGRLEDWPSRVGAFLAGDITEGQFLKAAESTNKKIDAQQHCEAYFYSGAKALANGEKAVAIAAFEKCIATGIKNFTEYRSAQAELRLLKPKP